MISVYLLSRFVDFHEIWYGGDAIEANLDAIILNPIASTIVKPHHCCFSVSVNLVSLNIIRILNLSSSFLPISR
jgi:hypothetical protein